MDTCIYMCGWAPSLFTWHYHNVVNRLHPNTKEKCCCMAKKFFLIIKEALCYKNSFFLILSAMLSQPITWSNWSGKLKTTPSKPWPWRARLLLKEAAVAASVAPWCKSLWESTFQQVLAQANIIRSLPGYNANHVWGVLCSFKSISSKKDEKWECYFGGKQMPLRLEEKCQLL